MTGQPTVCYVSLDQGTLLHACQANKPTASTAQHNLTVSDVLLLLSFYVNLRVKLLSLLLQQGHGQMVYNYKRVVKGSGCMDING